MVFQKDFLLGAATAAHQVEGNNTNSDLWVMENLEHSIYKEPSLGAVNHYKQYKEDLQLMKNAGLDSYRFTIEWARIEPQKRKYSQEAVDHYREKLKYCHEIGITPVVTLHHFSSPFWLTKEGGWESEETITYFERYTRFIVKELGEYIPYICTINEANMGVQITKLMERMKKGNGKSSDVQVGINTDIKENMMLYYKELGEAFETDPSNVHEFVSPKSEKGNRIIMTCHEKARDAIKEINSNIKVGVTLSLHDNQAVSGGEEYADKAYQEDFLDFLPYLEKDDFIGLQNYSRQIFDENGIRGLEKGSRVTKMGYEFYPKALSNVIRFVSEYWDKDILITENGISTDDDKERIEFIDLALKGVEECLEEGLKIIGYLHWSLLDNFEWQLGYAQTFGLIAVDRKTQKRYPKDSLKHLGKFKSGVNES